MTPYLVPVESVPELIGGLGLPSVQKPEGTQQQSG